MRLLRNLFLMKISRLIILLIGLSLSSCATGYLGGASPPLSDVCFTGIFSNGNVSIQVIHNRGMITASGLKRLAGTVPWEYLWFNGNISRRGEARGEITLTFLPDFGELPFPDVIIISLPNDRECNLRNS